MTDRNELQAMLTQCLREYAEDMGVKLELQEDSPLMGRDSNIDSLGLVMVIAAFEARLNDRFGTQIVLADDRAMSMERSPFGTPRRLVDYAMTLLLERT